MECIVSENHATAVGHLHCAQHTVIIPVPDEAVTGITNFGPLALSRLRAQQGQHQPASWRMPC